VTVRYVLIACMAAGAKSKWRAIAALGALSLLSASGVLKQIVFTPGAADELPHGERQALPFVLLAIAMSGLAAARGVKWPRARAFQNAVLIGLGLFVVPAWLISYADAWIPAYGRTALLTLTPVFAFVFEPYLGSDISVNSDGGEAAPTANRNDLVAGLVALVGALCVFPVGIPASIEADAALCAVIAAAACIAAANCKAVACVREEQDSTSRLSLLPFIAIATATAAIAFAAGSLLFEHPAWAWQLLAPELIWAAIIEVPGLLLLFWLMRQMSATRMTTRFLWGPLIAITLGSALIRAVLAWRTWLGLLLMAAGAAYLLLAPKPEPESTGLSLR
jgi:drug/metabolite transporter (DMT)-like permease